MSRRYSLFAYDDQQKALFNRLVFDKAEARREIMKSPFLYQIAYVRFNGKAEPIAAVYRRWPIEKG